MVHGTFAVASLAAILLGGSAHGFQTPSTVVVTAPRAAPAPATAPAAAPTPAPATASPAGVAEGERIVCSSVRGTGTRVPERSCVTKNTINEKREAARRDFERTLVETLPSNVARNR